MSYKVEWSYDEAMAANPKITQDDIEELKEWITTSNASYYYVPKDLSENMLLCFHNACRLNVNETKKCLQTYFNIRKRAPEIFDDRDMTSDELINKTKPVKFSIFPVMTDDKELIMHQHISDPNVDLYHYAQTIKLNMMSLDRCLIEHGPVNGMVIIVDMKNIRLGHMSKVSLMTMSKTISYIQDGIPIRISKIIIMNTPSFFNKAMSITRPFMKKELSCLMQTYTSDIDYEEFYRTVLPKRCLPAEYGGDLPDLHTLDEENRKRLAALKPVFEEEEIHRYVYNTKTRPIK